MKRIDYNPNSLSHHNENIQYWVTQGIVIDGERYSVEELFVRGNTLYGVISTDKIDFYEYPLATNVTQDKFDPSGILNRLDRLESIPQYKYDDTGINQRLDSIREDLDDNKTKIDQRVKLLENKPDNDNQNLSISGNNLSISGGNTVEIPQPDLRVLNDFATKEYVDTLVKSSSYNPKPILDRIEILEAKPDKDTVYDDTDLKQRVKVLEDKPEKADQTLAINDRTISISNGNSIELPADKDTVYDDTALKQRVKDLEDKPEKANQTLAINDRTISISGGNSIELPADKDTIYDDTALKQRVKDLEDKPEKADQTLAINNRTISISNGNSIELPTDKDTIYDDSDLKRRVSVLEAKPNKDTITKVVSTSNGVNVSSSVNNDIITYDVNIDRALDNYYDKAKTYTKDEVDGIVKNQEQKATDITVYKGKFSDRSFVKEGDYDTPISPRITLTYSKSTGVGILKIDFNIVKNVSKGQVIATLPNDAPVPAELVESQVWIGNVNTSIWVNKNSRSIQISHTVDSSIFNKRIILNIPGIFKLIN